MPTILSLMGLRQKGYFEFETSLDPCLNKKLGFLVRDADFENMVLNRRNLSQENVGIVSLFIRGRGRHPGNPC